MITGFITNSKSLTRIYEKALASIKNNYRVIYNYPKPIINEGGMYDGVWLEGSPLMGIIYGAYEPQMAMNMHMVFIANQDEEGFLPPSISSFDVKTGHIQTVVPFARTALMAVKQLGLKELLLPAYEASVKYDDWLTKYRNKKGTGLVEVACHWDTGHDNSTRHDGQPNHFPDYDSKKYPDCPYFLAPDLSATKYGGRIAMVEMAEMLGLPHEAAMWREKAEELKAAIMKYTFNEDDCMFYDRKDDGTFNWCKSDALTRVLQEHIPDQELFEKLFERHINNPKEFWTPYPLASLAVDDPRFVWSFSDNNWGGAAQAHAAMRVPLWMEYYGKMAHQRVLMEKWLEAFMRTEEFQQQMNPFSGEFNTTHDYAPAMIVLIDFVSRLYGVTCCEDGTFLWGCTKAPGATFSRYHTIVNRRRYTIVNENNKAILSVDDQPIQTVYGDARIRTDADGRVIAIYPTGVGGVITEEA